MTAHDPLDDPDLDELHDVDEPDVDEDQEDVDEEEEAVPELVFASVDEWFRRYWRFSYRRRVSGKGTGTGRWSARWWENDEAIQRLTVLWRGWEAARQDPALGTSAWWVNHADPHMGVLLSVDGPFATAQDENAPGEPLPYKRPPAVLFEPDRQPAGIYDDSEYPDRA
ncbi:DUF4913 domain-containing protein [Clavibacter michiganensis]|uniref:DUF4913 domain-containing protein n=1 Tax=Clavibacter michiganensis TaxID=28447 RepID=UPI003DA13A2A